MLFSAVNVARKAGVNSEMALSRATDKFIRRFEHAEEQAKSLGKTIETMTTDELDTLWKSAKTETAEA